MAVPKEKRAEVARAILQNDVRGDGDYQVAHDAPVEIVWGGAWVTMRAFVAGYEIDGEEA